MPIEPDEDDDYEPEEIYNSSISPDPGSALDVLAFVLAPTKTFLRDRCDDDDEYEHIAAILYEARVEAIERWQRIRAGQQ